MGGRGNPFALRLGPAAPTDADLARREAYKDARTRTDDMARTLGIDHGRADVIEYRLDDGSDARFTGSFDGRGAAISLRW